MPTHPFGLLWKWRDGPTRDLSEPPSKPYGLFDLAIMWIKALHFISQTAAFSAHPWVQDSTTLCATWANKPVPRPAEMAWGRRGQDPPPIHQNGIGRLLPKLPNMNLALMLTNHLAKVSLLRSSFISSTIREAIGGQVERSSNARSTS